MSATEQAFGLTRRQVRMLLEPFAARTGGRVYETAHAFVVEYADGQLCLRRGGRLTSHGNGVLPPGERTRKAASELRVELGRPAEPSPIPPCMPDPQPLKAPAPASTSLYADYRTRNRFDRYARSTGSWFRRSRR